MSYNTPQQAIKDLICQYRQSHQTSSETLKVAVMVSGGLDSMVLLTQSLSLCEELDFSLSVVYVDFKDFPEHKESKETVLSFTLKHKLPVLIYQPEGYLSTKTSARDKMKSAAMRLEVDLIMTAHHADDQIETFLFRALRGSGLEGLAVMQPLGAFVDPETKVRKIFGKPFLNLTKDQLHAVSSGVPYVEDSTNLEDGPDRNYIRNQILPVICKRYNKRHILNTIEAINEYLTQPPKPQPVSIENGRWSIELILGLPVLNRVFLVRLYLSRHHGYNLTRKKLLGIKEALSGDLFDLRLDLGQGWVLRRNKDDIEVVNLENSVV